MEFGKGPFDEQRSGDLILHLVMSNGGVAYEGDDSKGFS
jgi:hypothetical protein